MNIKTIFGKIQRDPELGSGEKLLVCLNRSCDSMLEDAWLLTTEGDVRNVCWEASMCDQADEAAIRLVEDGPDVVAFHESWASSRDGRPNGIRIHHGELDFPCVVFHNSGSERLTVDGKWVEPDTYTAVLEEGPQQPGGPEGAG